MFTTSKLSRATNLMEKFNGLSGSGSLLRSSLCCTLVCAPCELYCEQPLTDDRNRLSDPTLFHWWLFVVHCRGRRRGGFGLDTREIRFSTLLGHSLTLTLHPQVANTLAIAAVCPFVGYLQDLFGKRYIALFGALCLCIGCVCLQSTSELLPGLH